MQLTSLLKIEDIKYEIIQYFDVEAKLYLGKAVKTNFLNHFNFNIDYDSIIDISKMKIEPINKNKIIRSYSISKEILLQNELYKRMAYLHEYDKDNLRSKTSNIKDIIENSIDTLYALEVMKAVEFYDDLDIQKYEVETHIVSIIK